MANIILLFCLLTGGNCVLIAPAHVTSYAPELGGINCNDDCTTMASGLKVADYYGIAVACGPSWPIGTSVYIEGLDHWFVCLDRGGGVHDNDIDVLVHANGPWLDNITLYGEFNAVMVRP